MSDPLNLMAADEQGLAIISACLQDSLTRLADMSYQKRRRRFVAMFSRYRWEDNNSQNKGQRVRAGVHFDGVSGVRAQGLDLNDVDGLLDILALTSEPSGEGFEITMIFAGGGAIKLDAECIDVFLSDIGAVWDTANQPDHKLEQDL